MNDADDPRVAAAREEWYARHWDEIYRYVYRRVQNREEAEDLTQETCTRVLAGNGSSPPAAGYLYAVALNLIRDRWRRLRARRILTPLEEAWLVQDDHSDRSLDRLWLRELLERLPEDQRTVLRLRIVEGCSRAETARRMRRSEASVRGLQYRAIQALREMVERGLGAHGGRGAGGGLGAQGGRAADGGHGVHGFQRVEGDRNQHGHRKETKRS